MVATRLLDTAIEHFGRLGYEGASTRAIAQASGTAMSSITYHFGGKEGLYLAAADRIVELVIERQAEALAAIGARTIDTRADAIAALLDLTDSFALMMLSDESALWARFIIREQMEPTAAFDRIWDGLMDRVASVFLALLARVRDDLDDRTRRATGMLTFGQAIALRAARASICRVLDADTIGPEEAALLRARLRRNTLAILEDRQ